jgi:kynureninase
MSTLRPEDLFQSPNAIADDYSRFRVAERPLLTGHSHQAWPDVAFDGMLEAFTDAAELVDDKWPRAFEKANAVRRGYARLLGDPSARIALSRARMSSSPGLSALPLKDRPRLVTTDGSITHPPAARSPCEEGIIDLVRVARIRCVISPSGLCR